MRLNLHILCPQTFSHTKAITYLFLLSLRIQSFMKGSALFVNRKYGMLSYYLLKCIFLKVYNSITLRFRTHKNYEACISKTSNTSILFLRCASPESNGWWLLREIIFVIMTLWSYFYSYFPCTICPVVPQRSPAGYLTFGTGSQWIKLAG